MGQILMPKATAVWLIENTTLTFNQISAFCGLHPLEVQSIADGEIAVGMVGFDPITSSQLTREEISRCEADQTTELQQAEVDVPRPAPRTKGPRYTPVARRQDRPDAISWLVKSFPELSDGQIARLVGTTKPTINGVRDRTHWNIQNIKPRDPVALGLCSREDLSAAIEKARRAAERVAKRKAKADAAAGIIPEEPAETPEEVLAATPEEAPVEILVKTPAILQLEADAKAASAQAAEKKPPDELTAEDVFGTPKPSEPEPTGGASGTTI